MAAYDDGRDEQKTPREPINLAGESRTAATERLAYRLQIRATLQAMSAQALAHQDSMTVGGIDREEVDAEIARRRDELETAPPAPFPATIGTEQLAELADRAERYAEHNAERFPETAAHQRRAASEYRAELERRRRADLNAEMAELETAAGFDQAADERTHVERQRDTARALAREILADRCASWRYSPNVHELALLVLELEERA